MYPCLGSAQPHESIYGEPIAATGTNQTSFGFTGEPTDGNGLVYLRARYYAPNLGVFTELDPLQGNIGNSMSLNRYMFVQGNVANLTDPSGLCASTDRDCQTAVSCLERDFPSIYIYWDNRPATIPSCQSSTATRQPTVTPCPTPAQPTVTIVPTLTITPVPMRRFNGLTWDADAISVIHDGLKIMQRARGTLPLFNAVLARVNLASSAAAQTFYRNDGLHPVGAFLTILFSRFWDTRRNTDPAYGKWIVVHELNHGILYQQGPSFYQNIARSSKAAFIGPETGVSSAKYPTQYAYENRENTDNPEYLVDSMTGLVWNLTGEAVPLTSPEIYAMSGLVPTNGLQYPYNVSDITSIDGKNTLLEQWIRSNVPNFVP